MPSSKVPAALGGIETSHRAVLQSARRDMWFAAFHRDTLQKLQDIITSQLSASRCDGWAAICQSVGVGRRATASSNHSGSGDATRAFFVRSCSTSLADVAAFTIATIPARTVTGSVGQASTSRARSGPKLANNAPEFAALAGDA